MRPGTVLVMAAMVLVGGCSIQRVEPPTFGPAPTVTTTPFPSLPTGLAAPVKYTQAALKSCPEIGQRAGGLPPSQPDDDQKLGSNSSSRACRFKAAEQTVTLSIRSWDNTDDARGVRPGAEYATKDFTERTNGWEKDSSVNLGSDARWRTKSIAACALEILDENSVLIVSRSSGAAVDEEQCRGSVRELAKKFYAAVQP